MIIYEVNVQIHPEDADRFVQLVRNHAHKILTLNGFTAFKWYQTTPPIKEHRPETSLLDWTLHYHVRDQKSLDFYFQTLASVLWAETREQFGERVKVERRILELVEPRP